MSMRFSFYWYFQNLLILFISLGGSVGRAHGTNLLLMGAWVRVPLMQIFFSIGKIRGCGTLKFLVWLTSESRFSNLKKKLVIKRVWNNWFLQWNKKFIQSQNCYASWKFALFLLFLVQKCTKKGSNPNFLELWDLVHHINFQKLQFWVPWHLQSSRNRMKIGHFSWKKMPKNCRLSFHPNLIVTQQTNIFIIKFGLFCAYFELFKKIAMCANPTGPCQR